MNETFLEEFEWLAELPNGVAELRSMILGLAVQGRLLDQHSTDESASASLRKARVPGSERPESSISSKPKFPPIDVGELPFTLPPTWAWVRLGELGRVGSSRRVHKKDWRDTGVPFYRAREIVKLSKRGQVENELFIDEELYQSLTAKGLSAEAGDIMITGVGTIGVPYVVGENDRFYFKDASVLIFKNDTGVSPQYLKQCFESPPWRRSAYEDSMGTTVRTLTVARASMTLVPLPPLAEQKRIVTKVGQLMALCDELEAKQTQKRQARTRLNEACLDRLLTAQSPDDFAEHWQRIHDNFDGLYDAPGETAELSRAAQTLGVFGRLTSEWRQSQPTNSAEAKEHFQERDCLEEPDGTLVAAFPPIPSTWQWTTLGALTTIITSGSRGWKKYYADAGSLFIRSQDIKKDRLEANEPAFVSLPGSVEGKRTRVERWDILTTITGANVGKCAVLDSHVEDGYVSQHVALARLKEPVFAPFVHAWMTASGGGRRVLLERSYGDKPGLNLENLRTLPVPMPPLEEQRVVMASIERLLAIGSALQVNLTRRESTAQELLAALVHALASNTEDTSSLPTRSAPTDGIATREQVQALL